MLLQIFKGILKYKYSIIPVQIPNSLLDGYQYYVNN